jgi:hypothetical protein
MRAGIASLEKHSLAMTIRFGCGWKPRYEYRPIDFCVQRSSLRKTSKNLHTLPALIPPLGLWLAKVSPHSKPREPKKSSRDYDEKQTAILPA